MYQTITPNAYATETFHLVRSRMEIGRLRVLLGFGICIIPTFFSYAIYYAVFDLSDADLIIATSVTGLILLNCTLFLLHKSTKKNRTLIIGYDNFRIMENSEIIQIIPFEKVNITKHEQTQSQTFIRISTKEFTDMIIGQRSQSSFWESSKNKMQTPEDCITYFTKTDKEWFRLAEALKHFL